MRVISGMRKGHRLKAPKTNKTRPTDSKVKESIFNILGDIKDDGLVLDLFAGSGAIGIEFLSRGARECFFVDKSRLSIDVINENLRHTKLDSKARVYRLDSLKAIDRFNRDKLQFNYIYLDPPFNKFDFLLKVLEKISERNILAENGIIIIEHSNKIDFEDIFKFKVIDSRKYGSKYITFIK